ncbi:low molecular weight phosphotyrosine protein phosphatase [Vibrio sp.]|nr:low molecular weight phosphotyrosine protein phosphatase [Vibrio sp.]
MNRSILVVCSGNICRSPYAEKKLQQLYPEMDVSSAGLIVSSSGLTNKPAANSAIRIASESGVDLRKHRARQLSEEHVIQSDLILAMERHHLEQIVDMYPFVDYKVFLLSHWNGAQNIEDPYRKNDVMFRLSFHDIDEAIETWGHRL